MAHTRRTAILRVWVQLWDRGNAVAVPQMGTVNFAGGSAFTPGPSPRLLPQGMCVPCFGHGSLARRGAARP